ncbi:hypothetical protein BDW72DRAFT_170652 [Aspergillus terricola var. indicus]
MLVVFNVILILISSAAQDVDVHDTGLLVAVLEFRQNRHCNGIFGAECSDSKRRNGWKGEVLNTLDSGWCLSSFQTPTSLHEVGAAPLQL